MKDSTTIDGVVVTREQVERAMRDLGEAAFEPGDHVRDKVFGPDDENVVVNAYLTEMIAKAQGGAREGYTAVVDVKTGDWLYGPTFDFEKVA